MLQPLWGAVLASLLLHLAWLGGLHFSGAFERLGGGQRPHIAAKLLARTASQQEIRPLIGAAVLARFEMERTPPGWRPNPPAEALARGMSAASPADRPPLAPDDMQDAGIGGQPFFFPSRVLQRSPLPISAPDPRQYLAATDIPAIPLRLRLYIDAAGMVVNIDGDFSDLLSQPQINAIKTMFYATTFIPGHFRAQDVASYMDIEVQLTDFLP